MRRAAGAGDDHLEARGFRAFGESIEPLGRAVGGDDAGLVGHVERVERLGGMFHGLPVGLAAHDNGYRFRSRRRHDKIIPCAKEAPDYRLARWTSKAAMMVTPAEWLRIAEQPQCR